MLCGIPLPDPQGEHLPMLEPEHLARRRRRVPAPTPGTVSPTALLLATQEPAVHPETLAPGKIGQHFALLNGYEKAHEYLNVLWGIPLPVYPFAVSYTHLTLPTNREV